MKKYNNIKKTIAVFCILWTVSYGFCQEGAEPKENILYQGIIEDSVNIIENDGMMYSFFEKLKQLENGEIDRVNIVHIGDSHIQADWLSGTIRVRLQRVFGNAGRGLVFPHKVAGSNAPPDVYSYSNRKWVSYRNLHKQSDFKVGIGGYVIGTNDSAAILKISLNDKHDMGGYDFNKITLFHPSGEQFYDYDVLYTNERDVIEENIVKEEGVSYTVKAGDYLGKIASLFSTTSASIKKMNGLSSDMIYAGQKLTITQKVVKSEPLPEETFDELFVNEIVEGNNYTSLTMDSTVQYLFLASQKSNTTQSVAQWDGFSLEHTDSSGLLYHTIGVNGAQYFHYNDTERFFEQLEALSPDLIIVSLGANESFDTDLEDEEFIEELDEFYNHLDIHAANTPVLISTPPDNRKQQTRAENLAKILKEYAHSNAMPLYDLYNILGGKGSFYELQLKNFARKDKIHFHASGYEMQGQLTSDAILKAYEKYKTLEIE
ncbi:MAG: LysM peptidoglycan-binding domain-containing protein [Chitinophagales bacterium]